MENNINILNLELKKNLYKGIEAGMLIVIFKKKNHNILYFQIVLSDFSSGCYTEVGICFNQSSFEAY